MSGLGRVGAFRQIETAQSSEELRVCWAQDGEVWVGGGAPCTH